MAFYIGVSSQAQHGKDTLADYLQVQLNKKGGKWKRTAFAFYVKKLFCETFGVDLDFVEKWKTVPENPPGFDMPMRNILQFIGDGFRKIQSKIWLDLAFKNKENEDMIISDGRYVNEFVRVKRENGINILVFRPDKLNDDENGSEAQIKPYLIWCKKNLIDSDVLIKSEDKSNIVVDLTILDWSWIEKNLNPPKEMNKFDLFVCNCGSVEDLKKSIDKHVVEFCFFNWRHDGNCN